MKKSTLEAKGKGVRKKYVSVTTETTQPTTLTPSVSKALSSLDIFKYCIERAKNLIKLHKAAHGKATRPEKHFADAHRAAIVLAISALDAFIRSFVLSRTRKLLGEKKSVLPDSLLEHIKRFLKYDDLIEAARKDDLLDRVEKAFMNDFERRSFQGTKNIEEYLQMVGFSDVFHKVAIRAKLNEDSLKENLDRFTNRRHTIAHRGDYDLTQNPPIENRVTKKDANECIKLVSTIANCIYDMGVTS